MSDSSPSRTDGDDVALLCGPTEDRQGTRVLRLRQGELQAGEARPVKEGSPLNGRELVRLRPRKNAPVVCDVEVLHPGESEETNASGVMRSHSGPAQVATDRYRANWERIFGLPTANLLEEAPSDPAKQPN